MSDKRTEMAKLQHQAAETVHTGAGEVGKFIRWAIAALLVGGSVGTVIGLFRMAVSWAVQSRAQHPALLFAVPLAGLLIVWLYRSCGLSTDPGTDYMLLSVRTNPGVQLRMVPLIAISTVLTHLCGGSAGRMGAALQMGGSISGALGHWARMDEKDCHIMTMCGMAAGFSALFGTPLTATVFALEVISVGVLYYAGLVPCLTAALTGYLVSVLMGVPPTRFTVTVPGLEVRTMLLVMVLALLCAVVSILFCRGLHGVEHLLKRTLKNPYLRVAAGAAVLIGLTLLTNGDYNGAGMEVIGRAIAGQADPWAWVWKLLFTAITIGCGFKGGEVVPSFFVGAAFGCVAAGWLGLPAGFGAAMGLVSVFCGAVNCPLASIILSVELFGSGDLLYFAMACSISYLISGYCGLYSSQTILYSKLRAEFINVRTHE